MNDLIIIPTREALLDLYEGDLELLIDVIDVFVETAEGMVDELARSETPDALASAAHSLKGAVVNFGAEKVRARLQQLEEEARSGDVANTEQSIGEVRAMIDEVIEELTRIRRDAA